MGRKDVDASDDELIQDYLENQTSPAEETKFRLLLRRESFRRRVAEQAIEFAYLCDRAAPECDIVAGRASQRRLPRRIFAATAAAACLLVGLGVLWNLSRDDERPVIAHVAKVTGLVLTAGSLDSNDRRVVTAEAELGSGDMLQTVGVDSFAILKFDDDSVLAVAGDTILTCSVAGSQKRIVVRGGDIMAQVTAQPAAKPMMIETPVAHAEVVGTTLSLFASLVMTELAVMEGQVRLRQLADNQTVDVKEGESAVATKDSELVTKPISPVSTVWEEDFEETWPKRWRAGHWIQYGLPEGSRGAVRGEVVEKYDGRVLIATGNEWSRGLFRIEDDTHLNLTYKLNVRRWFYVRIDTRTEDYGDSLRCGYFLRSPRLWNIDLHQWRTVTVPMRYFYDSYEAKDDGSSPTSPKAGEVVVSLAIRSQIPDPELFVDRIWVTKGPAEGAVLLAPPRLPLKAQDAGDHLEVPEK